jgi:hypothetical protein
MLGAELTTDKFKKLIMGRLLNGEVMQFFK